MLLSVWDIAKWPVLVLLVSLMLSILYYGGTLGGVIAFLTWL